MTETDRSNAMRDLWRHAQSARQAAQEQKDQSKQLRLKVGALLLEDVAAFIYWRDRQEEA